MSETIDVQILGKRNLSSENRSNMKDLQRLQKQVYEKKCLFLMMKYHKV